VGLGTVSRAFSGRGKVAAATRERILKTAARLGYAPNTAARALAGQKGGRRAGSQILVAYLRMNSYRDAHFMRACRALGLEGVCMSPDEFESPAGASRILNARGVDAILCNSRGFLWTKDEMERFAWDRFSVVVLGRDGGMAGYELVWHSAFDSMRTALHGLRDAGFRRVQLLLHRSISPADDDARLGAALAFQQQEKQSGVAVRIDNRGRPAYPTEHVVEPVWEPRASLFGKKPPRARSLRGQ
jgi:LacI family transcriptional regulator